MKASQLLQSLEPAMRTRLQALAETEGLSVEQLFIIAAAEKLARSEHPPRLEHSRFSVGFKARSLIQRVKRIASLGRVEASPKGRAATTAAELTRLSALFKESTIFVAVLKGPEHVYETVNDAYRHLLGRRDFIGKRVVDAIPELADTVWMQRLDYVYRTGTLRVERSARLSIAVGAGEVLQDKYVDYSYESTRGPDGNVNGIIVLGVETAVSQRFIDSVRGGAFPLRNKAWHI